MTDHNDAPDEHTPEGGIPTEMDGYGKQATVGHEEGQGDGREHPKMPGTMIDAEEGTVTIDAAEVKEALEAIQPGEPLPIGTNNPEAVAEQPPNAPPGMPKAPDVVDRTIAAAAQHEVDNLQERRNRQHVRFDQATVIDAREGSIHDGTTYDTRAALLAQIKTHARREREAAEAWARAVREREEQREVYLHAAAARESAEEALYVLGLDKAGDHERVEPNEVSSRIPDDVIF